METIIREQWTLLESTFSIAEEETVKSPMYGYYTQT